MYSTKQNKDSPDRQKIRYLKTLNDEVLSKTQMALLAINDYEMRKSRVFIPKTSFVLESQNCTDRRTSHKTLKESEELHINMLGQSIDYYRIDCRDKIFPLKFEFKSIKNVFRFMASFKHMFPGEGSCQYDFFIDKAMRKNIDPKITKNIETLFISIQAKNSIGIMTMHFNFYNEMLDSIRKDSSVRIRKHSDFSPIKTFHFRTDSSGRQSPSIRLLTQETRINRSQTSMTNFRNKNIFEAPNYQEITQSRRILTTEKRYHRMKETQSRRDDFWQHKKKQTQLKQKANTNKKTIVMKQVKVSQEIRQKRMMTKDITAFLYMHKLLSHIHQRRVEQCQLIRTSARILMYQNKFCRTLKDAYKKTCVIMPSKASRNKSTIHSVLYLLTRMDKQTAEQRAVRVIVSLLSNITPSLRLNESLNGATDFRRKLRKVQKAWRTKYNTRLEMIKMCGQRHVKLLLDTYPKFYPLQGTWKSGNHLHEISLQYIRETTVKFNEMYMGYFKKKDELYDLNRINEQVRAKNRSLPAKQQKPLLYVPPDPVMPHYRFFRDLDILRGMIRNWFEIQGKKSHKRTLSNKLN